MKYILIKSPIESLYKYNSLKSEISDEILHGMFCEVLRENNGEYLYVKTEYNYKGYINKCNLILDDTRTIEWIKKRNAIIINNFVDVLEKPKIQSKILRCLLKGAFIYFTGNCKDNFWSEIELADGRIGWVKSSFLRNKSFNINNSEDDLRENLVRDALSYIGTQYRWGGKTPAGIDCSGLCSMVYMLNNIKIYRDACIKEGFSIKEIKAENKKKGDLLYFPNHVALYIGNDKYIHSSNINNIVKINSLDKKSVEYREDLANSLIYVGSIF